MVFSGSSLTPPDSDLCVAICQNEMLPVERDTFKEWFDLAYKQRLVLASTKGEDGQMYVYNIDGVLLPFVQVLADHPLDTLKLLL